MEAPAAPHHIYAGVSSILSTTRNEGESSESAPDIELPSLIAAVYYFVTCRLSGRQIAPKELSTQIVIALEVLNEHLPIHVERDRINELSVKDHMRLIAARKWVDMDWFQNIRVGSGLGFADNSESPGQIQIPGLRGGDVEDQEQSQAEAETDDTGPIIPSKRRLHEEPLEEEAERLRPGLGTMMQEAVDYLSEDHGREFAEWKAEILEEIRQKGLASKLES